jgi:hypothetical protein
MQGLPGSAHSVSTHARGLRPRRVRLRLARTASTVLPSACSERVGTREKRRFRGSILCLRVPLSTLRRHRYRCLRMTRGQCGWLDLHCLGLAPFTTVPACPGACPNKASKRPLTQASLRCKRWSKPSSDSRRRRMLLKINDLPHMNFVNIKSIESTTYAFYAVSNATRFELTC